MFENSEKTASKGEDVTTTEMEGVRTSVRGLALYRKDTPSLTIRKEEGIDARMAKIRFREDGQV